MPGDSGQKAFCPESQRADRAVLVPGFVRRWHGAEVSRAEDPLGVGGPETHYEPILRFDHIIA